VLWWQLTYHLCKGTQNAVTFAAASYAQKSLHLSFSDLVYDGRKVITVALVDVRERRCTLCTEPLGDLCQQIGR